MMKHFKFFFRFTRDQRRGIVALFAVIILLQAGYLIFNSADWQTSQQKSAEEKEWLAVQSQIDALKSQKEKEAGKIFPFNPNFISDYKGYTLGMSTAEIDRLHKFREGGKFVNSAEEFKVITKVPDTLLQKISPYFKFPDWVKNKNKPSTKEPYVYTDSKYPKKEFAKKEVKAALDINQALEEDLIEVYGIGPAFAKMILRRRAQLGAYVSMEQMSDFKNLSPEAVAGLKKSFKVSGQADVVKLNVNTASLNQLSSFPYFNRDLGKAILTKRSMKGKISKIEELTDINDFPVDKINIITLYLEF